MSEIPQIVLDTPSSSGESEKLKESCQRKKKKFVKHGSVISQIPRANSAHRIDTVEQPQAEKFKEPSKSIIPYRIRKSLSQTDMKSSSKNNSRYQQSYHDVYHQFVLPKPMLMQDTPDPSKEHCYSRKSNLIYMVDEPENVGLNAKAAGMKIFATIMLNAWRKRRDDVRRLNEEVDMLQRRSIKVKNQIHVLNSVFRNEQKQNDKLNRQLRHTSDELQRMQSSVQNLTTSLINTKAEASLFEQQYQAKERENESLNNILTETKSQLFKAMTQIRHLQTSLSCEQRNVQELENQKNEFLNEIMMCEIKSKKEEEQHLIVVYQKDQELSKANSEIKILETLLLDLKEKEFQVRDLKKTESKLKNEVDSLKSDIRLLKANLNKCVGARFKHVWRTYVNLHRNTMLFVHIGAYYLLPALPPPSTMKMPITLSLEKVMSVVRD